MEDFERMEYREHQRQELLSGLKTMISNQMEEEGIEGERDNENAFYWGLIVGMTNYIHGLFPKGMTNVSYMSAFNLSLGLLLSQIETFTPVRAERDLIVSELLKFVIDSMSRPVYSEILRLNVPPARTEFLKQIGLDNLEQIS